MKIFDPIDFGWKDGNEVDNGDALRAATAAAEKWAKRHPQSKVAVYIRPGRYKTAEPRQDSGSTPDTSTRPSWGARRKQAMKDKHA